DFNNPITAASEAKRIDVSIHQDIVLRFENNHAAYGIAAIASVSVQVTGEHVYVSFFANELKNATKKARPPRIGLEIQTSGSIGNIAIPVIGYSQRTATAIECLIWRSCEEEVARRTSDRERGRAFQVKVNRPT